jgi:hypothetical protein
MNNSSPLFIVAFYLWFYAFSLCVHLEFYFFLPLSCLAPNWAIDTHAVKIYYFIMKYFSYLSGNREILLVLGFYTVRAFSFRVYIYTRYDYVCCTTLGFAWKNHSTFFLHMECECGWLVRFYVQVMMFMTMGECWIVGVSEAQHSAVK